LKGEKNARKGLCQQDSKRKTQEKRGNGHEKGARERDYGTDRIKGNRKKVEKNYS